jgi:hypothetical protein
MIFRLIPSLPVEFSRSRRGAKAASASEPENPLLPQLPAQFPKDYRRGTLSYFNSERKRPKDTVTTKSE